MSDLQGVGAARAVAGAGEATPSLLGALYFGYYCVLGGTIPYFAMYLEHRGLTSDTTAYVLAALPIVGMLAAPAWTLLADHLRSVSVVLRVTSIGAFAALVALELRAFPVGRVALFLALVAFTAFRAPTPSLLDTLGLSWARTSGGDYGRLRAWGTAGYTLAAFLVGALVDLAGPDAIVHTNVVLLAGTAAAMLGLRGAVRPTRAALLPAIGVLARRPRFLFVVGTGALHELGLAAYETFYPTYLTHLAGATYAGAAIAFGAASEVAFMAYARRLAGGWSPERMLVLAYAGSCARWGLLAIVREPHVLVAVQALNALTFGAFFLAAVTIVDQESPESIRASGQGLFGAMIWGLTRAIALLVAGAVRSRGGMPAVFSLATVASAITTALAIRAARRAVPGGAFQ